MDLDLNQEPFSVSESSESPNGLMNELSPWLNELETAHERIEERIRQLESIVSRIRNQETTTTPTTTTQSGLVDSTAGVIHERSRERLVANRENRKTHLIAKALNMEKATSSVPGGYFDCNICLEKAENPILTCCGHLFCWGCFYQLPLIYLNIKECPVCDGEVTDSEVIPVYGNGDDDTKKPKLEDCGIRLPPRPNAKRVESVRQKIINRGIPFIPVHETIEHIRRTIDSIGLQALAQGDEFGLTNIITNEQQRQAATRPVRLPPPHLRTFASSSFPGLVVDTSEIMPPAPPPPFVVDDDDDNGFGVDTRTTTSLRRNRRRSLRLAEIGTSPDVSQTISFRLSPVTREFAVPGSTRSLTVNPPTEVVTLASSSRRRTEDVVDNVGPRTRSRRRLR